MHNASMATDYLDQMFGTNAGHVAVAYKDQGDSWQEHQFEWPAGRNKLIGWARIHKDANVFICPALRGDGHTRKKGDGVSMGWLWADVDMDKVPADKQDVVRRRIDQVGTYVVSSGSGENAHVYVDLGENVDVSTHLRLNTGLRDYLYADNKQSDNSLLRLPGTTNWKTADGSKVSVRGGHGKRVRQASLLAIKTFSNVSVMAMANSGPGTDDWALVDVAGLPRRIRAMATMSVEEAEGRYGSRHKAVWAVTGDLHKAGLDPDMIHSLMDRFPAALDKRDEEHGEYDVHKDVERRLNVDRTVNAVVNEDDEDGFEEVSDEQVTEELVSEGVAKELLRRQIRREADMAEAVARHVAPPDDVSEDLSDALTKPADPVQWLVEGMASADANVIITGQYKTGKTALMVASLIPALVDNEPFLGEYAVTVPDGGAILGHWNLEMPRGDLVDKYMRSVGIKNVHNVKLAHLRGHSVNLLTEPGKEWAVEWLSTRQVQVWTIDSYAQLARMAGINSNDNDEVYALMGAIDEVKRRAGVRVCFLLGHTGRNSDEKSGSASGLNATRGASAIDEAVDARWVITKDASDIRYIATEGRDVTLVKPTSLTFDEETKRSTLGVITKATAASVGHTQVAVMVVAQNPGIGRTELIKLMKESGVPSRSAGEYIQEAIDTGFIRAEETQRVGRGGGRKKVAHWIVGADEAKVIDFTNVKPESLVRKRSTTGA